jgi:hypothetical protein
MFLLRLPALPFGKGSFNVCSVRRSLVLAVLGLVVVVVATSGIAALPWASNSGCADSFGTRDADVSLQLVPFGLVCDYQPDSARAAETIVRAPSIPVFVAWLLFVGAVVALGLRRRAMPWARGLVSGICVLGLFGGFATIWEMSAAMMVTVLYGVAVAAVVDLWLWPAKGRWWALLSTALLLPFSVVAVWFAPGLYGAEALATALGLAAAAAIATVCSRVQTIAPPPRMKPLGLEVQGADGPRAAERAPRRA